MGPVAGDEVEGQPGATSCSLTDSGAWECDPNTNNNRTYLG